ncbi:phosphate-binding protein [Capsulimonas corticalis]|uniref:Phosphate-binding protein n=1 Tax=Capsulimonas corticalis TaxID=2219043 RepID=A0A402D3B7_9BACT|nr:phosphate-binding protein [Capsulimonas corticalis]
MVPAAAVALGLLSAGCGDNGQKDNASAPASTGAQTASSSAGGALNGAGATFPAPLYQKWFQEYQAKNGVQINYQAIGSGGGIKGITAKSVDFGASDAPMNDEELAKAPGILHVPTVAGAVAMAYNVPGVPTGIHLTGDVIADIFLGKITKWNDARITVLNPGKNFPALTIAPVHRADGSGTTNIFTTYLSQVSPTFKAGPGAGKSVKWTAGVAGKGNAGVGALVQQTQGAIGYLELAYAIQNKIAFADVQNAKGAFITPSVESTTAAAAGVTLPDDFRAVITNTDDPKGYPITGFTFLLVYKNSKPDVKKFLQWALTDGQKDAPTLIYAPLPDSVQKKALAEVDTIQ